MRPEDIGINEDIRSLKTLEDAITFLDWQHGFKPTIEENTAIFSSPFKDYVFSFNNAHILTDVECIIKYPTREEENFEPKLCSHKIYHYPTRKMFISKKSMSNAIIDLIKYLNKNYVLNFEDYSIFQDNGALYLSDPFETAQISSTTFRVLAENLIKINLGETGKPLPCPKNGQLTFSS